MTDPLDELVILCLDRMEEDGPGALDALCREHPEHAAGLRSRVGALAASGLLADAHAPPGRLGDFRLGRRLGGGGMGVVYAAVQESLGREVALKIVRADQLYFPGSRERFRREGRLVARLSHASIVPVHTVGEEGGVPFLAMELLRGATLAELLATLGRPPRDGRDLAAAVVRVVEARDGLRVAARGPLYGGDEDATSSVPGREPVADGESPRGVVPGRAGTDVVLRIGRAVASALAHAHSRGVLHRDLKASNVMLTVDGRALLFDFGLAHSTDAEKLTRSGARVGSLPYMAPEQLRGDGVDERTDVYGLGALLCEALTLRAPHEGTPDSVAAAILRGEPVPLRARRPDLPRDVEIVLLKALDPDPARRYARAADMLRDIEHLLARRPVEARPAGPLRRAVSWTRRHPARAALLAVVIVAPAAFALQQAASARREAGERARAEDNLDRVLDAVGPLVAVLDAGVLEQAPYTDASRIGLLEDALTALEPLLQQRADGGLLAARVLRLHVELGAACMTLGRADASDAHFRAALALDERFDVPLHETARAWNGLGNLLDRTGRTTDACAAFETASAHLAVPAGFVQFASKSAIERNVARLNTRLSRTERAVAAADAAVSWAERALSEAGDEGRRFEARLGLGAALRSRAMVRADDARALHPSDVDDPARAAYARALPLLLELAAERPQHGDAAHEAIAACMDASSFLSPREAESVLRHGLALSERLLRDRPDRVDYARSAAGVESQLGLLLVGTQRLDEARECFVRGLARMESCLQSAPDDSPSLITAGRIGVNLASVLVDLERRAEAAEPAARARDRLQRAATMRTEDGASLARDVAWASIQEGYGRLARGEFDAARRLAEDVADAARTDATLAVASGELLAGCAGAEIDAERARFLGEQALDRLELGLQLGFTRRDYLLDAPEWDALRGDPRFIELVTRGSGVP